MMSTEVFQMRNEKENQSEAIKPEDETDGAGGEGRYLQ